MAGKALLIVVSFFLISCATPESSGSRDFVDLGPEPQTTSHRRTDSTWRRSPVHALSVEQRPLEAQLLGDQGPCLMLLGGIHGNEPGSVDLVRDFVRWLDEHPIETRGLRLVVADSLNPDGLQRGSRRNARGVDLNRNFPSKNFRPSASRGREPLCEPESRFLARLIETHKPDLVITVHQPRRSVNWDGPAEDLARAMARRNGYRPEATVGYSTPGSLGSWVGIDQGLPIITLELPSRPGPKGSFLAENLSALVLAMASLRQAPRRHTD